MTRSTTAVLAVVAVSTACGVRAGGGVTDAAPASDVALAVDAEPLVDASTVPDATDNSTIDVSVVITADNAYSFGYGDVNGINVFIQGERSDGGAIFDCPVGNGPDDYTVPAADAPNGAYLYIISWDDLAVTQGVIAQFARGSTPLYSGDPVFQVCATGVLMQTSQTGPTQADTNAQIAICDAGTGDPTTTSAGWVNGTGPVTANAVGLLAVGQDNSGASTNTDFPQVCPSTTNVGGMDLAAHWMWYAPPGYTADPFEATGSNTFRSYLIFRVAATSIVIQ